MKYRALDYLQTFDVRASRENFSKEEYLASGFWVIGESREKDYFITWGINMAESIKFKFLA